MTDQEFDALMAETELKIARNRQHALNRQAAAGGSHCGAEVQGRITGKCGDTMEILLSFDHHRVSRADARSNGCSFSSLCGSVAAQLAIGKTPEELFDLTGTDVLDAIGTFPEHEQHCAFLAVKTMQEAVNAYMVKQVQQPGVSAPAPPHPSKS